MFSNLKSVLPVKILHLAFSLGNAYSMGFLSDINFKFKMTCTFAWQDSNFFMLYFHLPVLSAGVGEGGGSTSFQVLKKET